MQILNAGSRSNLTVAQVNSLLTGNQVTYTPGLELLDTNNNLVSDISDRFSSGEVDRNNALLVQGTCKFVIEGSLKWGVDRVRPYMTVSDGSNSARFNLGVYVLTTPTTVQGETPVAYNVVGYDTIYLLLGSLADTYVVSAGSTYLSAVQALITTSGLASIVVLDGTLAATVLQVDMVWALDPTTNTTWLSVINALLATINYVPIWADQDGILHSSPFIPPANRAVEWVFDTSDPRTNIVGPAITLTSDVWAAKNWWRFVRKAMTVQPVEGAGIYTVTNPTTGRTSILALGRTIRATTQYLDASDQASLVAQGDQIVALDKVISRSFQISVDPLPIASNYDVVQFTDSGSTDKCQVITWTLPLNGSQGTWTLEAVSG